MSSVSGSQNDNSFDMHADRFGKPIFLSLWREAWGNEYPEDVQPFSSCTRTLLAQLAEQASYAQQRSILDLGCGTGGPGLWLARELRGRLTGIDRSAGGVRIARERAGHWLPQGSASFSVRDFADTRLKDESHDVAISIDALPFAKDVDAALREVRRVLRPAGRLIFTVREARLNTPRGKSLGPGWSDALGRAGFMSMRSLVRSGISEMWRDLYQLWLSREKDLRGELADVTVDRLLEEVRDVEPRLSDDRAWLLVVAKRA